MRVGQARSTGWSAGLGPVQTSPRTQEPGKDFIGVGERQVCQSLPFSQHPSSSSLSSHPLVPPAGPCTRSRGAKGIAGGSISHALNSVRLTDLVTSSLPCFVVPGALGAVGEGGGVED